MPPQTGPLPLTKTAAAPPHLAAALALLAAVLAVYLPALANGFVWDDTALVLRDPLIRSWWSIGESFRHFLFLDATGSAFYRPLQRLTFIWDYAWFGFEPAGWHGTSLVAHAAAVFAVHAFAREFLGRFGVPPAAAFATALVWAVHPVHTSAVVYVSGRADPLAALFGFLALRLGIGTGPALLRLGATGGALLAAALSKESGILFGPLWILLLYGLPGPKKHRAAEVVTVALVWLVYAFLRTQALSTPVPPFDPPGVGPRIGLGLQAVAEYVGLLALPLRLTMERDLRLAEWGWFRGVTGALLIGIGILGGLRLSKQGATARCARLALLLAGIAYLPVSGLIPLNATCAEHWLYVPSAFLALAGGAVWHGSTRAWGHSAHRLVLSLLTVWLLFLCGRTWLRNADWRDQATFVLQTIGTADSTARMRMNLASMEFRQGRRTFAIALQRSVIDQHPHLVAGRLSLAAMLLAAGRTAEAGVELSHVGDVAWLRAGQLELRASLAAAQGDPARAEEFLRDGLVQAPRSWALQRQLTRLLVATDRSAMAATELAEWMQNQGGSFRAESWVLLAESAAAVGDRELAEHAMREAHVRDVRLGEPPPGP